MPNQLSGQRFFEWRIRFQILAATGTGTAVCIAVTVLMLVNTVERNTEVAGLTTARAVARQVETVRTFYTAEVVGRAKSARMQIDYDFHSQAATLPLPATLVNELGEELSGSAIQLYSAHPFPNHKTRMLDEFQNAPLHAAADNPYGEFYKVEVREGRRTIRLATPDRMRAACADCHNSHPESPKTDWKEGDVRGVVEVVIPVDDAQALLGGESWKLIGIIVGSLLTVLCLVVWVLKSTSGRIHSSTGALGCTRLRTGTKSSVGASVN